MSEPEHKAVVYGTGVGPTGVGPPTFVGLPIFVGLPT